MNTPIHSASAQPSNVSAFYSSWLALLLVLWLAGCKSEGVGPDGDSDSLTLKAQQTELLNNPSLAVALSGEYRAVRINWYRFENSQYFVEGYSTYGPPDPEFIKSDYRLKVTPTAGKDSIRLMLNGDGYGGKFTNHDLGAFAMNRYDGKTYYPDPLDYLLESWEYGLHDITNEYQMRASRLGYADKTELGLGFTLARVINTNSPNYGKVAMSVNYEASPTSTPRNYQPWGDFSFTRRSTGVLANRK